MERRVHQPDRTRIDVPERVSPDHRIRRADVRARPTANAAQRRRDLRIRRHPATPVVEQQNVHLLARLRPGDARRIRAQLLRRRRARQQLQLSLRIGPGRHQLLDPRRHEVHARQRRRQPRVALVRDQHDAARLRDQRVRPRQPGAGAQKVLAQAAPRARHHRRDVVGIELLVKLLAQQRRHALPALMNRRHHQMARALARELQQPLPQVRLDRPNPLRLEVMVELDLLRDHRLALHHQRNPALTTDPRDVLQRILRRRHLNHGRPRRLRVPAKLGDVSVHPLVRVVLRRRELPTQLVEARAAPPLQHRYLPIPRDTPRALKVQQSAPQMRVRRRPPVPSLKAAHRPMLSQSGEAQSAAAPIGAASSARTWSFSSTTNPLNKSDPLSPRTAEGDE